MCACGLGGGVVDGTLMAASGHRTRSNGRRSASAKPVFTVNLCLTVNGQRNGADTSLPSALPPQPGLPSVNSALRADCGHGVNPPGACACVAKRVCGRQSTAHRTLLAGRSVPARHARMP